MLAADTKIYALYNEFLGVYNEGGFQNHSRQFADSIAAFKSELDNAKVLINIVCLGDFDETNLGTLLNWLGAEVVDSKSLPFETTIKLDRLSLTIHADSFEAIQSTKAGSTQAVCDVILISGTLNEQLESEMAEYVSAISQEKAYTLLCTSQKSRTADQLFRSVRNNSLFAEQFSLDNLPEKKFLSRFAEPDFIPFITACVNYQLIAGMEGFNKILDLMVQNEERSYKAKKALGQQQAIKLQSKAGPTSSDVSSYVKTTINNQFSQLEKAINDSFESYARPVTGDYSKLTESIAEKLEQFEEIIKSKKKVLNIPKSFTNHFLAEIRKSILGQGHQHLIFMRDSIRETESELNDYCEKNGIPALSLNLKYLTDATLLELLDSAIRIEKDYEGKLPQKGFYEYFMAMRKYQMLFFMVASTFGLSFLRNRSMMMYTLPLTIILMAWGGYSVYKTVNEEAEDLKETELANAKDVLKNESKRIVSEVSRTWLRTLTDHLRNQSSSSLMSIENTIKDYFSKKNAEDEEEKKKVQRQMQGIDNSERKMVNVVRAKETHLRNIQRTRSEFRQAISLTSKKVTA